MTNNTLTLQRIVKARRAMSRASNPKFRLFWYNVMASLETGVVSTHG